MEQWAAKLIEDLVRNDEEGKALRAAAMKWLRTDYPGLLHVSYRGRTSTNKIVDALRRAIREELP